MAVGSRALSGRAAGAARVETVRPEQDLDNARGSRRGGGNIPGTGSSERGGPGPGKPRGVGSSARGAVAPVTGCVSARAAGCLEGLGQEFGAARGLWAVLRILDKGAVV